MPFLEKSIDDEEPFLATVWLNTPHEPVVAGFESLNMYLGLPERQKHLYGAITAMDEQIGRIKGYLHKKE